MAKLISKVYEESVLPKLSIEQFIKDNPFSRLPLTSSLNINTALGFELFVGEVIFAANVGVGKVESKLNEIKTSLLPIP